MKISPLSEVSLASDGFTVVLNNISCVVDQREQLEKRLRQRDLDLEESGKLFSSLFRAAGEGILLVEPSFLVVGANERALDIFGLDREELVGLHCGELTREQEGDTLLQVIRELDEGQIWVGELAGRRAAGDGFPMEVTVNRVDLAERSLFHVVVRDITERKELENSLQREKAQLGEMNVTLRNVMKSIDQERQEVERSIASKIEAFLLPAIDKLYSEPSDSVRSSYLDLLKDQLIGLTHGFRQELDPRLLSLTRTEMTICQMIQSGSASKDIAEAMAISYDTVQTHRKSIRKKLGLVGKSVNLYAFLASRNQL